MFTHTHIHQPGLQSLLTVVFYATTMVEFFSVATTAASPNHQPMSQSPATSTTVATAARPRPEMVWVDPLLDIAPDIAFGQAPISSILYVNRCTGGCTITPGVNDARADTSSIIKSTVTIAEFAHSDEIFNQTMTCLREVYAPYHVEIVTDNPGDTPHHEAILAGRSSDLGFPDNVGGLAPASCTPLDNVISYSFASTIGSDPLDLCWTVAQESAHAFGLPNHVRDCFDPMTYIPGCGQKFFRDEGLQCGDFEADVCRCGGGQFRNSHRTLLEVFGPGQTPAPPTVMIGSPRDGDVVEQGFDLVFYVDDGRVVENVYVMVNGTLWDQRKAFPPAQQSAPYRFVLPDRLPDGVLNIEVRARNDLLVTGVASITVTKGAPCSSADQCLKGQRCDAGACSFPPAAVELGAECADNRECFSGLCPEKGGNQVCSEFCNPADKFSCPLEFECIAVDTTGVCWPIGLEDAEDAGCCQVSNASRTSHVPPVSGVLLAWMVVALLKRRRYRTPRSEP